MKVSSCILFIPHSLMSSLLLQNRAIAQIFADLWTEYYNLNEKMKSRQVFPEDLLSSSDGISVYLNTPDEKGGFYRQDHNWLHWDRGVNDKKFSLQGFVNLLPTSEGGAAFEALERSHGLQKPFKEFKGPAFEDKRFYLITTQEEADFFKTNNCTHICIKAQPGDLVLWNSRLMHCGRPATREAELLQRAVVYVSMQPRWLATDADLQKKKKAWERLQCTGHNAAHGVELFDPLPRAYGPKDMERRQRSRPISIHPHLNPLGRKLFALE